LGGGGGGGLRKETEVKVSETRSRRAGTEMAVFPHCPRIRPSSHLPRFLGQSRRIGIFERSPHSHANLTYRVLLYSAVLIQILLVYTT
jgi:hypothetical protein